MQFITREECREVAVGHGRLSTINPKQSAISFVVRFVI